MSFIAHKAIRPSLRLAGEGQMPTNYLPRRLLDYEVFLITRGKGRICLEDRDRPLAKGDLVLIPPDLWHGYRFMDTWVKWCHFDMFWDDKFHAREIIMAGHEVLSKEEKKLLQPLVGDDIPGQGPWVVEKAMNAALISAFEGLEEISESRASGWDIQAMGLLCTILSPFIKENKSSSNKPSDRLDQALDVMRKNAHRAMSLDEIARSVNLSPFHFARSFKKRFGKTPVNKHNEIRIHSSCRALEKMNSVNEVASEFGFANVYHYSRRFKSVMGISPGKYRQTFQP